MKVIYRKTIEVLEEDFWRRFYTLPDGTYDFFTKFYGTDGKLKGCILHYYFAAHQVVSWEGEE